MRQVFLATLFTISVGGALAEDFSGAALYRACASPKRLVSESICMAYIGGIKDGLSIERQMEAAGNFSCIPQGISGTQAQLIVEKHMRDHPEELNRHAGLLVFSALARAFPCKKSN